MGSAVILIPAYNPDGEFVRIVEELSSSGFRVIAVNDGSSKGAEFFEAARPRLAKLLVHERNRGKGAALKTGFAWIYENMPDADAVVTADADGQHRPDDVRRVAEAALLHPGALVIGARAFTGNVPLRSRFGNWWSRWTFFILTRVMVHDTQTGLRGIPRKFLPRMLEIKGDRYGYEMRMLADARYYDEPPVQVPIETVYLADNASSHFHPVRDAIKTQWALFSYCVSSITAFLVDNGVYALCMWFFSRTDYRQNIEVLVSIVCARLVSSNLNYVCNRVLVFNSRASWKSYFEYWGLVVVIAAASWAGTAWLSSLAGVQGAWTTIVKIVVETVLFAASYLLQKHFIFADRKRGKESGK